MVKLTWNQRRALERLVENAFEGTPREISESYRLVGGYLCGSAARTSLMALQRKGLVDCIPTSPLRYRINSAGRAALAGGANGK